MLYKEESIDFSKDRNNVFNTEKQYEKFYECIYHQYGYSHSQNFNINDLVAKFENGVNILDDIEGIKAYTDQYNHIDQSDFPDFCHELYSVDFIEAMKKVIRDPQFVDYYDFLTTIIRNLWKMKILPDDCAIFDNEFISTAFCFFLNTTAYRSCLVFNAFHVLLMKNPNKFQILLEHDIIGLICRFFSDLDATECAERRSFPFFFIQQIILLSPPNSLYFISFLEICIKFISDRYNTERKISTQCIYYICSKNPQLMSTFFSIPNNIKTVFNAHILNHLIQFKSLYALDTILLKSENKAIINYFIYDEEHFFIRHLSNSVFDKFTYQNRIKDKIKHVLLFLSNTMNLLWRFLFYSNLYSNAKETPIIYRILDISNNSSYKERAYAIKCISHFIIEADIDAKLQVGQNGAFSSLCLFTPNTNDEILFIILCALRELLMANEIFKNEASQIDLPDILYQNETDNEKCKYLIFDIFKLLDLPAP